MTGDTRRLPGMATSYDPDPDYFTYEISGSDEPPEIKIYWGDYLFDILCGAVVNWIYSGRFNEWSLHILYWKNRTLQKIFKLLSPYIKRGRFYFSGFCSRGRGRHWHRESKLQRN